MAITPYTKPVESTFVNTRPQLPIQSIATAANQLQQRQNIVRDELDELRNTMVQSEPLAQNKDVFAQATEGIRDEIGAIAEDEKLFNKLSRVRQLSRDFAQSTKVFKQNQQNAQAAMEQLEETEMPERVKSQFRNLITQQASLQLDDKGNVDPNSVFSGINVGDETDVVQFALDRAKNIEDRLAEQGNFEQAGNGLLRRKIKEGVTKGRVRNEVLTSLGYAKDPKTGQLVRGVSSGNPEVENYFSNRRQILSAQGYSEEEIQDRFRVKAKRIVAEAQNKYAGVDTKFKFRNVPKGDSSSSGGDSGKRVMYTGSVSNLPTTSDVTKDHPKYKEIKDREKLVLQNMTDMTGGEITGDEVDTYRDVKDFIRSRELVTKKSKDPARNRAVFNAMSPGGGRPAPAGTRAVSQKEAIIANLGEKAYDTWRAVDEKKRGLMKEMSFDSRIIGFGADRQEERKDAEELLTTISGETLVSPDVDSDDLFGSTESEKISSILSDPNNFTYQGQTEDGRYAVVIDHNNGNQQVRLRMDTPGSDPVFEELTNIVTGSSDNKNARILKMNNRLSSLNITSDKFTETGQGVSLSRRLEGYTARAGEEEVTFDNYFDRLVDKQEMTRADLNNIRHLSQNLVKLQANGKKARDVGLTPSTAHKAVITYLRQKIGNAGPDETLPPDMKSFLDKAMEQHVPFDSRGEAHLQATRFDQL